MNGKVIYETSQCISWQVLRVYIFVDFATYMLKQSNTELCDAPVWFTESTTPSVDASRARSNAGARRAASGEGGAPHVEPAAANNALATMAMRHLLLAFILALALVGSCQVRPDAATQCTVARRRCEDTSCARFSRLTRCTKDYRYTGGGRVRR